VPGCDRLLQRRLPERHLHRAELRGRRLELQGKLRLLRQRLLLERLRRDVGHVQRVGRVLHELRGVLLEDMQRRQVRERRQLEQWREHEQRERDIEQ
jgi:hypothetical protein